MRTLIAANPSPMTLDGTRTYVIGKQRIVIIDPGPHLDDHMNAVAEAVGSGAVLSVLLTHTHPDHAEGAAALAERLNTRIASGASRTLDHHDTFATDEGEVRALATPGHTPDHFSFWWPAGDAVFCGDLMMGGMDTALVARPEGDLGDYLASLKLLKALRSGVIYPAHGEPFNDPEHAILSYISHREERVQQVLEGLKDGPLPAEALLDEVYGSSLDPRLRHYAETAIEAYLAYLHSQQRVRELPSGMWKLV